MAAITKRLEKRWIAEGDELAHNALSCINELRGVLEAVTDLAEKLHGNPGSNRTLKKARAVLRKFQ